MSFESKAKDRERAMNDWEIIADDLSRAGWSYGYVSALDREGRIIWIADAHREGKRFIARADELLTFLELQRGICIHLLTERTDDLDS